MAFENNQKFINAKPFPHIYFDNFLDTSLANEIKNSFPDYNDELSWVIRDTENIKKRYQGDDKKTSKKYSIITKRI